jgi:hypothetical protein
LQVEPELQRTGQAAQQIRPGAGKDVFHVKGVLSSQKKPSTLNPCKDQKTFISPQKWPFCKFFIVSTFGRYLSSLMNE